MTEIKIKVDFENKHIHGIECEYEDKYEVHKVLLNIATAYFNKTVMREKSNIIKPKTKIIGGHNGGK